MQAAFVIGTRPEASLDEEAAHAAVAAHRLPDAEFGLMGRIVLSGDGLSAVEVRDDLEFLIPNLCWQAPRALSTNDRTTVTMASRPTRIDLLRAGDEVRMLDDSGAELGHFPTQALMTALNACGARFANYVEALAAQDDDWSKLRDTLRQKFP